MQEEYEKDSTHGTLGEPKTVFLSFNSKIPTMSAGCQPLA